MAKVTTLPAMYQPMMGKPSVRMARCAVCGRTWPLEQHHVVFRSAGKMFVEGREIEKPTITLCGFGNNLQDADGREYCHGLAHHRRLYFRWVDDDAIACAGHWEYIRLDEACDYLTALRMDGWRPL
ncbi:hypothetical protein [uncultured Adlercreutzia sp.]|uniref:hypothetical protein n=1 Tax=uncultured Adlercreutzia sp. TaxID=875803 RepID=UPI0026755AE1|nr:hypothetical protein [uncultured Adlercreutzia sp.]